MLAEAAAVLPRSLRAAVAAGLRRAERLSQELPAASRGTGAGASKPPFFWVERASKVSGKRPGLRRARAGSPGAAGATEGEGIVRGRREKAASGVRLWARPVATMEAGGGRERGRGQLPCAWNPAGPGAEGPG